MYKQDLSEDVQTYYQTYYQDLSEATFRWSRWQLLLNNIVWLGRYRRISCIQVCARDGLSALGGYLFKFSLKVFLPAFFWCSLIRWFKVSYQLFQIRKSDLAAGVWKSILAVFVYNVRSSVSYVMYSSDKSKMLRLPFILVYQPSFFVD